MSNNQSNPSASAPPNTPNQTTQQGSGPTHVDKVDNNSHQPQNSTQHNDTQPSAVIAVETAGNQADRELQAAFHRSSPSDSSDHQPIKSLTTEDQFSAAVYIMTLSRRTKTSPPQCLILPHLSHFFQMTMPLCEAIQTTPAIQAGARILAPLLLHSSNVAQKRTEDERMRWFRYTRGETWDKEFNSQLKDLEAIAPDIKRAVERSPNVTIKKIRPDTKPPQTTLERLDAGWLQVPAGLHAGGS
ncbi:hypothetical protein GQ44DRAFT_725334 [Phaeosphaeriaceae sp. PMI808]|nr:hypothetical protein GQ44DRAFT_763507 [Phaeosphaeriaceae sp. PMI808]KAH8727459.1 hypothetical protein GQ44DRAFT_725334 [Phaeosphaeriaceae sp. PMI808]